MVLVLEQVLGLVLDWVSVLVSGLGWMGDVQEGAVQTVLSYSLLAQMQKEEWHGDSVAICLFFGMLIEL
jgi:hypothetical protein